MELIFSQSFVNYILKCDNPICRTLHDYIQYSINSEYFTADQINYITFRTDGTISYLPKGKQHVCDVNDKNVWKRDNRQNGGASKVIRKVFTKEGLAKFNDKDFETFTNCYKSEFNDEGLKFELKNNKVIPEVYNNYEIAEGSGSLNQSCMNGNSSSCFQIYEECKDLQILCLLNKNNELCGRALIWKLPDDVIFMDRVYVVKDFYVEKFVEYATENKWIRKEKQSYDYKHSFVNPDGTKFDKSYKINLKTDFDEYPYIDTFTYGGEGWLSNSYDGAFYEYTCTSGERSNTDEDEDEDDDTTYDDIDDCRIDSDDARYIDRGSREGETTHRHNVVQIYYHYWWIEDDEIVEIDGRYYKKDSLEVIFCPVNDEWYRVDDCVRVMKGKYASQLVHEDDVVIDINDDAWWKGDDNITRINGQWYEVGSEEFLELLNEVTN